MQQEQLISFKRLSIATIGLFICYGLLMSTIYALPYAQGLCFAFFQILGILLPGTALVLMLKLSDHNLLQLFSLGYACGYALNILTYFLLYPFGLKAFVPVAALLLCVLAALCFWRRRIYLMTFMVERYDYVLFGCTLVLFLLITFFTFSLNNLPPSVSPNNTYYHDLMFWAGHTVALSQDFPPVSLTTNGFGIFYHYFSSVQLAFVQSATGISVFPLSFAFSFIQPAILLVGGSYSLFRLLLRKKQLVFLGVVLLLFTAGAEWLTAITGSAHLFIAPFGFDIGYAFGIFFLYCMAKQYMYNKLYFSLLCLSLLMLFVCTGAKGPIALVILAFSGAVCLFWLLDRSYAKAFLYGGGILAVFGIVYYFVIRNPQTPRASGNTFHLQLFNTVVDWGPFFPQLYEQLQGGGLPPIIARLLCTPLWLLATQPVIFGLLALFILVYRIPQKHIRLYVPLLLTIICGSLLTLCTNISGRSQMYFIVAAYPAAMAVSLIQLEFWLDNESITMWKKTTLKVTIILVSIVGIFGLYRVIQPKFLNGYSCYTKYDYQKQKYENSVSVSDYEALIWIRDNTPQDSLLLTDRAIIEDLGVYFSYGVFSERHVYQEGWNYTRFRLDEIERKKEIVRAIFAGRAECIVQAKQEGVDYIVQTKRVTPQFSPKEKELKIVFENDSIIVYQMN